MTTYTKKLLPGTPAPAFKGRATDGHVWELNDSSTTLLVFYRGSFCSYCRKNLCDFDELTEQFAKRGVAVVFASADDEEKANFAVANWGIQHLRVCFGLDNAQMQEWGAFQSAGNPTAGQAEVFSEPSLFLIKSDGTLSYVVLNSSAFGRPKAADILGMIDFIAEKGSGFPQRGGWSPPVAT